MAATIDQNAVAVAYDLVRRGATMTVVFPDEGGDLSGLVLGPEPLVSYASSDGWQFYLSLGDDFRGHAHELADAHVLDDGTVSLTDVYGFSFTIAPISDSQHRNRLARFQSAVHRGELAGWSPMPGSAQASTIGAPLSEGVRLPSDNTAK